MKKLKSRKFRIIALVFTLLVGVSMLGTGIAAAEGVFNWSGTANVSVTAGKITLTTSTQGWVKGQGDTWEVTLVQGSSSTALFTITNTYGDTQSVKLVAEVSPNSDLIATWSPDTVSVDGDSGTNTASLTVTADDIATSTYTVTITATN